MGHITLVIEWSQIIRSVKVITVFLKSNKFEGPGNMQFNK